MSCNTVFNLIFPKYYEIIICILTILSLLIIGQIIFHLPSADYFYIKAQPYFEAIKKSTNFEESKCMNMNNLLEILQFELIE